MLLHGPRQAVMIDPLNRELVVEFPHRMGGAVIFEAARDVREGYVAFLAGERTLAWLIKRLHTKDCRQGANCRVASAAIIGF